MAQHEELESPYTAGDLNKNALIHAREAIEALYERTIKLQGALQDSIAENISLQDEMSPLRSFKIKAAPRLKALFEFLEALDKADIKCTLQTFTEDKWSLDQRKAVFEAVGNLQTSLLFWTDLHGLISDLEEEVGYEGER